jgi:ABC-type metal ion transport system substrate-binding protein
MLYAIDEVALVVIGILIALQVNNWNGERKSNILERNTLISLKDEFQKSKIDLQEHIQ